MEKHTNVIKMSDSIDFSKLNYIPHTNNDSNYDLLVFDYGDLKISYGKFLSIDRCGEDFIMVSAPKRNLVKRTVSNVLNYSEIIVDSKLFPNYNIPSKYKYIYTKLSEIYKDKYLSEYYQKI